MNFLDMEVGPNGSNLNEDAIKIIIMAKVLLEKPPILIIDEDAMFVSCVSRQFYIRHLFSNLPESGIICLTKDMKLLFHYQNALVMKAGELVEYGPPTELIDNKSSHLYNIVMKDDIRTLRQLENRLEKNIKKFELLQRQNLEKMNEEKDKERDSGQIDSLSRLAEPRPRMDTRADLKKLGESDLELEKDLNQQAVKSRTPKQDTASKMENLFLSRVDKSGYRDSKKLKPLDIPL